MDRAKQNVSDPFLILYHQRKSGPTTHQHKEPKRHHKDYSNLPHSIIMTRKMVAQQEYKLKEQHKYIDRSSGESEKEERSRLGCEGDRQFFCEKQLQKGIPVSQLEAEELALNLKEVSPISNYSKLERTLFGIGYVCAEDDGWDGRL